MQFHDFDLQTIKNALPQIALSHTAIGLRDIKYIGGGSYGRAFSVVDENGNEFVMKAYKCVGMNLQESKQLSVLGENTPAPMPKVIFNHNDESFSVLAMTKIEGVNALDWKFLFKSRAKKQAFADAVVDGMISWHEVKNSKFGELDDPKYSSWHEYYRKEKVDRLLDLLEPMRKEDNFKASTYELLLKGLDVYEKIGDSPSEAVLIHGDLNIMNMMADERTMALTGFIDPCGAMWASREYDLYQLRNMWGDNFKLYETYKARHSLPKESDFRIAFYALVNEILCGIESGSSIPILVDLCCSRLKQEIKKLGF